ncbi:MAG: ABC transporter ATP-binding protein [Spirochaetales bacterium]|nr:ABC transporter ATP-binding protein [Spirochaetales bacterium]
MPELLVEARDLEIRYGDRVAVSLASFEARRGEIVALLGPNGSGKTTLLKALGGLVAPSRGELRFDGRPLAEDDGRRARRVYVHQAPYLLAGSVFRNVAFGLRARSGRHAPLTRGALRDRVEAALEAVGLAGFAHREARALSGGESQRVALARALVLEPELLLLDEPTAAADASSKPRIVEAVLKARGEKTLCVILSSHEADLARSFADRVVRLEEGRPVEGSGFPGTLPFPRESPR